jgi:hypothetical protein
MDRRRTDGCSTAPKHFVFEGCSRLRLHAANSLVRPVRLCGLTHLLCEQGHKEELVAMYHEWPFFQSTIDLIEMVRLLCCDAHCFATTTERCLLY